MREALQANDVRKRLPQQPSIPQQAKSIEAARETVKSLNMEEVEEAEKEKRIFGRTPDGIGRFIMD